MTGVPVTWAAPQSDEWLTERGNGIGGSDIATLLGLNPYKTVTELWLEKTGRSEPFTGNYATDRGHALEAFLVGVYRDAHPGTVIDTAPDDMPSIVAHPDVPAARVSLDGLAHDKHHSYVLEVKTGGHRQLAQWDDDGIPQPYAVQVGYQLAVTGLDHAVVVADIGGEYLERRVDADDTFTAYILDEVAEWWWRHVHPDGPLHIPAPDPIRDRHILPRVWEPDVTLEPVVLDSVLVERLRDARAAKALALTDYAVACAEVQVALGEAVAGVDTSGDEVCRWGPVKGRTVVDTKRLIEDGIYDKYAVTGKPSRAFRVRG